MAMIEEINKMKNQGISDQQIISNLRSQGMDPRRINDAIQQSNVKNAVYKEENMDPGVKSDIPPEPPSSSPSYQPSRKEMSNESYEEPPMPSGDQNYDNSAAPSYPSPQYPTPQPGEEYYPQEYPEYGSYGAYDQGISQSTDTFIEIAEQIFEEKVKKFEKTIEDLNEFKALNKVKIDHALERIKRIENAMDKLQMAILDKVGSYGKTLDSIKKEMNMMQNSFSKIASTKSSPSKTKTSKKTSKKKSQKRNK